MFGESGVLLKTVFPVQMAVHRLWEPVGPLPKTKADLVFGRGPIENAQAVAHNVKHKQEIQ